MQGFDWSEEDSIIFHTQEAVAVYANKHGQIVIRQRDEYGDEDSVIVINAESARTLVGAIMRELDEVSPQLALPAPRAKTSAERQRDYRQRNAKCNGARNDSVTDSVTENVTH